MSIGFIGLGAMGKPMVKNLLDAKYEVYVNDVVEKAVEEAVGMGAKKCASPKELAEKVDVVMTSLPNAQIVEMVMLGEKGVFAGASDGQIVIDMSSVAPHSTRKIAKRAEQKGIKYIDAPVSGGVAGATKGALTIMVGGEKEAVQKVQPIFQVLGEKIYHVGEVGAGDAVKLVNNLLLGCNMAAVAEALVLGVKSGLSPKTMYEVIKVSSGSSYALNAKMENFILKGNFAAGFAVELQYKDLELAIETAKSVGQPVPMATMAQQIYEIAKSQGMGRDDISALVKVWEELSGVEVRE